MNEDLLTQPCAQFGQMMSSPSVTKHSFTSETWQRLQLKHLLCQFFCSKHTYLVPPWPGKTWKGEELTLFKWAGTHEKYVYIYCENATMLRNKINMKMMGSYHMNKWFPLRQDCFTKKQDLLFSCWLVYSELKMLFGRVTWNLKPEIKHIVWYSLYPKNGTVRKQLSRYEYFSKGMLIWDHDKAE